MEVHLMFCDKDFIPEKQTICYGSDQLSADLGIGKIIDTMADGDDVIRTACSAVLFSPLQTVQSIRYRQAVLKDFLAHPALVRRIYTITTDTAKQERETWFFLNSRYLSSTFSTAIDLLQQYVKSLMKIRTIADEYVKKVQSPGLTAFFSQLEQNLADDYFSEVSDCLNNLSDRDGLLVSASMGGHLQGIRYEFRQKQRKGFRRRWIFTPSYTLAERDETGARDFTRRRERAISETTNALAQSAEHLKYFFSQLRNELAFYIGCCNLAGRLRKMEGGFCIPEIYPQSSEKCTAENLYDVSLLLVKGPPVVPNDFEAAGKRLCIITGANQGGKSTFLRSVGQEQLMAQSGMFVCAKNCLLSIKSGIFTHFKREEDTALDSGKLDEELVRMDSIVEQLQPDALILFNESFASTNEREGSEISRQIAGALADRGMTVVFVTHQYEFANFFYEKKSPEQLFLRAERQENGRRNFKIIPGRPLETSYGLDIYKKVFGPD
ncbi:MAG: DNA mismatch repair protein MutS [Treponema sp.]|jgi:DNA mismatch repair ATPase MutS|nr:DNA mismatch repair protein MutS [Treponema sp.]